MKLFIGVDAGGTKTRAVVGSADLAVLGRGEAGPANAASLPVEQAAAAVTKAARAAMAAANVTKDDIKKIGLGLAGAESRELRARFAAALEREYSSGRIVIMTDARAALAGALVNITDPGIILIAGTGSVAYGRNRAGEEARAGGLGWRIGDEGSGYWAARRALEAVGRALDGRGPSTLILRLLQQSKRIDSMEDLINYVYRRDAMPADIAALFPRVAEAARAGDAVGGAIVAEAARELAELAVAVARKLNLQNETFAVAPLGGLWAAGDLLLNPVARLVAAEFPGAAFAEPAHPPELGALRIAAAQAESENRR